MDRIRRNRSTQVGIRYDGISQDKTRQDRVRIFVGYDQIRQVDRQVGRFIDSFVCTYMYANGRVKYVCTCNIHMYMIVHACLPYYTVQYRSLPYHSTLYHIIPQHTIPYYCTVPYDIISLQSSRYICYMHLNAVLKPWVSKVLGGLLQVSSMSCHKLVASSGTNVFPGVKVDIVCSTTALNCRLSDLLTSSLLVNVKSQPT